MKKIFLTVILTIFTTGSFAAEIFKKEDLELLDKAAEKVSSYVSNIIPGEGYTEVSIDFRQNYSPDYSILGVREVAPMNSGTFFTQFSLSNSEASTGDGGDERITGNLGFGVRKLFNDNTFMAGLNTFYDRDIENEHQRGSLGAELRTAVIETNYNYYFKIGEDGIESENVLEGYDFQLSSQIPYLHWAKVFVNSYEWYGQSRDDVVGKKIGSDATLTPHLNLEFAYDDKSKAGVNDEWYAKLQFIHPGKDGPTAMDGVSSKVWKEDSDMSGELLSKVERVNRIMIEFKGSANITRAD